MAAAREEWTAEGSVGDRVGVAMAESSAAPVATREAVAAVVACLVAVVSLAVMAEAKEVAAKAAAAAGPTAAAATVAVAVASTRAVREAEQSRGASAGAVGEEGANSRRPSLLSRAMARSTQRQVLFFRGAPLTH